MSSKSIDLYSVENSYLKVEVSENAELHNIVIFIKLGFVSFFQKQFLDILIKIIQIMKNTPE
jgi:hypothetical protein